MIKLNELQELITLAVDAGVQEYIRSTEPGSDLIKQGEARRYISGRGFRPVMLRKWTEEGLLIASKGESRNSAIWYSLSEIKKLICTLKLKEICNNNLY